MKPDFLHEDDVSMTIKEVTPEEVEARLKKESKKQEKEAEKVEAEGEIVMVDQEPTGTFDWEYPSMDLLNSSLQWGIRLGHPA